MTCKPNENKFFHYVLLTRQFYWQYFMHDLKQPIKRSDGNHFM